MTPTDEQRAATEAFQHNRLLKITAFAGAGKNHHAAAPGRNQL